MTKVATMRRYLLFSNQTLMDPRLHDLLRSRIVAGSTSFFVLAPEAVTPAIHTDPSGLIDPGLQDSIARSRSIANRGAVERVAAFTEAFADSGAIIESEVATGDPLLAARRIMETKEFDEIIVSSMPARVSRWLKLDLPNRVWRAFDLPVTLVVQRD